MSYRDFQRKSTIFISDIELDESKKYIINSLWNFIAQ